MKPICIRGSTGSIGTQSLDVIFHFPDDLTVTGLSANQNISRLYQQIQPFNPPAVCVVDYQRAHELSQMVLIPVYQIGQHDKPHGHTGCKIVSRTKEINKKECQGKSMNNWQRLED